MDGDKQKHTNRLINEQSPYLLQHSDNPVDWYAWNDEAFEKARKEDKPVFLSIGYSTCHWCHVMAHESFEDEEVAKLMNDTFVSIKVDREERPDVDAVYMQVCQMLTGSGGWPLTIIMMPDRRPFFAGTYIPKQSAYGRMGMMELINRVADLWKNKRDEIVNSAEGITDQLQSDLTRSQTTDMDEDTLKKTFEEIASTYDNQFGGFSGAPKFPVPHKISFLLRYWKRSGSEAALEMVLKTLNQMRYGGIFDQIGFGFHRYSTDAKWLVPHFEKMLYDQAMLAMAYTEAYQAVKVEDYRNTVNEIFAYVLRDLRSPEGAFYSAEDADSEGEEGKFYVWTEDEIDEHLGDDAALFKDIYGIEKDGNFIEETGSARSGKNILHFNKTYSELAQKYDVPVDTLKLKIHEMGEKLYKIRGKRVRPGLDDKILTDWNGLMISALAKGGKALGEHKYIEAAEQAADFIIDNMIVDDMLRHRYRAGDAGIDGMIDDYAFFVNGLLELYQADFNIEYLKKAIILTDVLNNKFWDDKNGGYYMNSSEGEQLIARRKELYDGAIPSGNSMAMMNLVILWKITGSESYKRQIQKMTDAYSGIASMSPSAFAQFMNGVDFMAGPAYEIVISGEINSDDTHKMLAALNSEFVPNKVVILRPEDDPHQISKYAGYTLEQMPVEGKATAYVCRNFACERPVTTVDEMIELIKG